MAIIFTKPKVPLAKNEVCTEVEPQTIGEKEKSKSLALSTEFASVKLPVSREQLVAAQENDTSLHKCFEMVVKPEMLKEKLVAYFVDDGMLMRKWSSSLIKGAEWGAVFNSGRLGITKTYNRVLRYFFWPGLKATIVKHCRSCHICQVTGKPNQVVPPAPLCPIPIIGEPFQHVIVDCVGPLPKAKSGQQFLLTIMCTATRFPEAVALRTISTKSVFKALTKFLLHLDSLKLSTQTRFPL